MKYDKLDMRDSYNVGYKQGQKEVFSDCLKFGVLVVVFVIIIVLL